MRRHRKRPDIKELMKRGVDDPRVVPYPYPDVPNPPGTPPPVYGQIEEVNYLVGSNDDEILIPTGRLYI